MRLKMAATRMGAAMMLWLFAASSAGAHFLQTDPAGYKDDQNLYAYVQDDPTDKTDPTGRQAIVCLPDGCVPVAPPPVEGAPSGHQPGLGDVIVHIWKNSHPDGSPPPPQPPADGKVVPPFGPPNPNGSRGSQAHQDRIKERIETLKGQGMTHVGGGNKPEETVQTPGGEKDTRRPDITMEDTGGGRYRENVGRTNQNGEPVSRERKAMQDIEGATGQCAFSPYACR